MTGLSVVRSDPTKRQRLHPRHANGAQKHFPTEDVLIRTSARCMSECVFTAILLSLEPKTGEDTRILSTRVSRRKKCTIVHTAIENLVGKTSCYVMLKADVNKGHSLDMQSNGPFQGRIS